jgi:hypothetical protein
VAYVFRLLNLSVGLCPGRRLREKEAAVLSSCTTEIRRLVAHGARELWRIRNWKDTQVCGSSEI